MRSRILPVGLDLDRETMIERSSPQDAAHMSSWPSEPCSRPCGCPSISSSRMVVLHVKSSSPAAAAEEEEMEFLYECAATAAVADVAAALAGTAGLQAHVLSLCRRLREGCAAGELERALSEAEAYASKEQVRHNRFLSPRALREHIKNIEKRAANALQESSEALCLQQPTSDDKHKKVQLWWAGKELAMDKKLCAYIGVNDKTKIVIRLRQAPDEP